MRRAFDLLLWLLALRMQGLSAARAPVNATKVRAKDAPGEVDKLLSLLERQEKTWGKVPPCLALHCAAGGQYRLCG